MFCNKCGAVNTDNARFCASCGEEVCASNDANSSHESKLSFDNNEGQQEYYEEAIGCKNTEYYLSRFNRFDSAGPGISWNWPALFVSFYWLLYRKMWLWALLYFFLPILLTIIEVVVSPISTVAVGVIYFAYLAGIFILLPMYANAIYYRHLNKNILKAKIFSDNKERRLRMIAAEGGTSKVVMIIVFIFAFIAVIGILAAIAVPSYQDYVTKAEATKEQLYSEEH